MAEGAAPAAQRAEFVGNQFLPFGGGRCEPSFSENNMRTERVCFGAKAAGRFRCKRIDMDSHIVEVVPEAWLHQTLASQHREADRENP